MMIVSPAPALKPTRMLSLTNRTRTLSLKSQANQPKQCHRACSKARDLRISYRVPSGQRPDGAGHHERDRGGRAGRKLARRSKQSIAEAAKHVAIDADLGRQPGKARIGQ